MATQKIHSEWSIDGLKPIAQVTASSSSSFVITARGVAPPVLTLATTESDPTSYTNNEILIQCWLTHFIARVLPLTPDSTSRVHSALETLYTHVRGISALLRTTVDKPPAGDHPVAASWKDEAKVLDSTILVGLAPHISADTMAHINVAAVALNSSPAHHWSSLAIYPVVMCDTYIRHHTAVDMPATTGQRRREREEAGYVEFVTKKECLEALDVLLGEFAQMRKDRRSGWREEEARKLMRGTMGESFKYFAL